MLLSAGAVLKTGPRCSGSAPRIEGQIRMLRSGGALRICPVLGQVIVPRPSWFILTGLPQEEGTRIVPISQGKETWLWKVESLTSIHVAGRGWGAVVKKKTEKAVWN